MEVPQENGARLVLERSKKQLTKKERIAFGFVTICGIGAVILGSLSIVSNVKKPFLISYTGPRYLTSAQKDSEEVARQRIADTDEDGISDYDELNIFFTSPYIADSDGDGRADGVEILEGGDPNCALGKTCTLPEVIQASLGGVAQEEGAQVQVPEGEIPSLAETVGALEQLPIADIRELLKGSGIDEETLAALTDEQVMSLYLEALGQASQELEGAE